MIGNGSLSPGLRSMTECVMCMVRCIHSWSATYQQVSTYNTTSLVFSIRCPMKWWWRPVTRSTYLPVSCLVVFVDVLRHL